MTSPSARMQPIQPRNWGYILKTVDALIFAAPPPPVGGIASIVAMLHQGLANRNDVDFGSPTTRNSEFPANIIHPFRNILSLVQAVSKVKKGGRVLLFSSAGISFFEKLLWSLVIISRGRISVIVMVDGTFPAFWEKSSLPLRRIVSRIVCHHLFELAAQSEGWRDYYRSIFPSANIRVVGATVSPEFFEYARGSDPVSRRLNVLYVGWIIPEKGILDLLDAMVIIRETHPAVRLRLVGPLFGREDYWNNAVLERGISTQVKFIGTISDRGDLIRELDKASVFVFPSHFEGFPVALLEAIAMGLACVGTAVGGIPDILDHGQAGILVAPKAPPELAKAIESLLDDSERMELLSKQAAIRARKVYSHSECMESYMCVLGLK